MTERERLHAMVDDLPEDEPVLKALREAPFDDEPLTDEDLAALREAEEDEIHGRLVPHEEIRRRAG